MIQKKNNPGMLFVVSAPSGAGKNTLINAALNQLPDLKYSVSMTTRRPRSGEQDGFDYYFVDHKEFIGHIEAGDFLEWAKVHGEYYGTLKKEIERITNAGFDTLLDIDIQGAGHLRNKGVTAVYLFIVPPTLRELKERLLLRGTDSFEKIIDRMETAKTEIQSFTDADFLIVNDKLEDSVAQFVAVIRANRLKANRFTWVEES